MDPWNKFARRRRLEVRFAYHGYNGIEGDVVRQAAAWMLAKWEPLRRPAQRSVQRCVNAVPQAPQHRAAIAAPGAAVHAREAPGSRLASLSMSLPVSGACA